MNPEAAEWLESLDEMEHLKLFTPVLPGLHNEMFSIKEDHEHTRLCEWEDWSL